jgi:serine acetyltransferase
MSGVTIGNGSVIGANTTVSKDVPPYAIMVGNPGKIIKYRFDEDQIKDLLDIAWWDWNESKIKEESMLLWSRDINYFIKRHKK